MVSASEACPISFVQRFRRNASGVTARIPKRFHRRMGKVAHVPRDDVLRTGSDRCCEHVAVAFIVPSDG